MRIVFIRLKRIITEHKADDEVVNVQVGKILYYQPDKFKGRNCTFIAFDDDKQFASGIHVSDDIVDIENRMQNVRIDGAPLVRLLA